MAKSYLRSLKLLSPIIRLLSIVISLLLIENVSSILIPITLILDSIAFLRINSLFTVIVSAVILEEVKLILLSVVIVISSIKLQELPNINPFPSIELLTVILLEIFEFVFNIFVIVIFDVDNAF